MQGPSAGYFVKFVAFYIVQQENVGYRKSQKRSEIIMFTSEVNLVSVNQESTIVAFSNDGQVIVKFGSVPYCMAIESIVANFVGCYLCQKPPSVRKQVHWQVVSLAKVRTRWCSRLNSVLWLATRPTPVSSLNLPFSQSWANQGTSPLPTRPQIRQLTCASSLRTASIFSPVPAKRILLIDLTERHDGPFIQPANP
jgi:hypothetical protein